MFDKSKVVKTLDDTQFHSHICEQLHNTRVIQGYWLDQHDLSHSMSNEIEAEEKLNQKHSMLVELQPMVYNWVVMMGMAFASHMTQ